MQRKDSQTMIYELLSHGAQNAISASQVSKMTNLTPKEIRHAVEHERLAGFIILSDNNGYYLPHDDESIAKLEISAWVAIRLTTAKTILKTIEKAQSVMR